MTRNLTHKEARPNKNNAPMTFTWMKTINIGCVFFMCVVSNVVVGAIFILRTTSNRLIRSAFMQNVSLFELISIVWIRVSVRFMFCMLHHFGQKKTILTWDVAWIRGVILINCVIHQCQLVSHDYHWHQHPNQMK